MPKDLKTGMFIGAVVAVCATILLSLFSSTVEQRRDQSRTDQARQSSSGSVSSDEATKTSNRSEVRFFSKEHIEPKLNDERMNFLLAAQVASEVAPEPAAEPAVEPVLKRSPPAETVSPTVKTSKLRIHEVITGETLTGISTQYFGTSGRFLDIYNANREIIKDMNRLQPGMKLRIPED